MGDRIAHDLFEAHVVPEGPRPRPGAVATAVVDALDAWSAGLPIVPELRFAIVHQLSEHGATLAIRVRKAGQEEEERWVTDWLTALGREILARSPSDAGAHVVMSWAGMLRYMTLHQEGAAPATREPHLREALTQAATALSLKPGDEWTRQRAGLLQERYIALVAPGERVGAGP